MTTSEEFRKELVKRIRAIGGKGKRLRAPASPHQGEIQKTKPSANFGKYRPECASADIAQEIFNGQASRSGHWQFDRGTAGADDSADEYCPAFGRNSHIVITQHMPPTFTKILAQNLARSLDRTVKEGEHGEILQPGYIYIAPGEHHMLVEEREGQVHVVLDGGPQVNYCRPAVDPMTISAAKVF